ncbi:hypothetical protein HYH03_018545 [Edaphochlamys debaryana]|uniref:Uncharacterized protein n=1 Tax=Edaphochlamys debaryana TaxID=47281 RepID=A0A835XGU1_9CHLO|nr:hypothetical protein HYH03_018545 [Edaphochlamys debaryana]|eukprot:KAG2482528.1 hypothetical protein HYH03_018545 [Edaphochlamys debaryana]
MADDAADIDWLEQLSAWVEGFQSIPQARAPPLPLTHSGGGGTFDEGAAAHGDHVRVADMDSESEDSDCDVWILSSDSEELDSGVIGSSSDAEDGGGEAAGPGQEPPVQQHPGGGVGPGPGGSGAGGPDGGLGIGGPGSAAAGGGAGTSAPAAAAGGGAGRGGSPTAHSAPSSVLTDGGVAPRLSRHQGGHPVRLVPSTNTNNAMVDAPSAERLDTSEVARLKYRGNSSDPAAARRNRTAALAAAAAAAPPPPEITTAAAGGSAGARQTRAAAIAAAELASAAADGSRAAGTAAERTAGEGSQTGPSGATAAPGVDRGPQPAAARRAAGRGSQAGPSGAAAAAGEGGGRASLPHAAGQAAAAAGPSAGGGSAVGRKAVLTWGVAQQAMGLLVLAWGDHDGLAVEGLDNIALFGLTGGPEDPGSTVKGNIRHREEDLFYVVLVPEGDPAAVEQEATLQRITDIHKTTWALRLGRVGGRYCQPSQNLGTVAGRLMPGVPLGAQPLFVELRRLPDSRGAKRRRGSLGPCRFVRCSFRILDSPADPGSAGAGGAGGAGGVGGVGGVGGAGMGAAAAAPPGQDFGGSRGRGTGCRGSNGAGGGDGSQAATGPAAGPGSGGRGEERGRTGRGSGGGTQDADGAESDAAARSARKRTQWEADAAASQPESPAPRPPSASAPPPKRARPNDIGGGDPVAATRAAAARARDDGGTEGTRAEAGAERQSGDPAGAAGGSGEGGGACGSTARGAEAGAGKPQSATRRPFVPAAGRPAPQGGGDLAAPRAAAAEPAGAPQPLPCVPPSWPPGKDRGKDLPAEALPALRPGPGQGPSASRTQPPFAPVQLGAERAAKDVAAGDVLRVVGGSVMTSRGAQRLESDGSVHLRLSTLGHYGRAGTVRDGRAAAAAGAGVMPVWVRGLALPVQVAIREIGQGQRLLVDRGEEWWERLQGPRRSLEERGDGAWVRRVLGLPEPAGGEEGQQAEEGQRAVAPQQGPGQERQQGG